MKIPAAKSAVDKEWEIFYKKNYQRGSTSKNVINEARANNRKVHFATLMDVCLLKHTEFDRTLLNMKKGRVVLLRDNAKDDTGGYAVNTEQGASVSHMPAAPRGSSPSSYGYVGH